MELKTFELVKVISEYMISVQNDMENVPSSKIYNALERNPNFNYRILPSDVFNALCLPYQSTMLFELSKTDLDDFYFKLKLSPDQTREYISKIEVIDPVVIEQVITSPSPISIPTFTNLMLDMENLTRNRNNLVTVNDQLSKTYNEVHIQNLALSNNTILKQQIKNCQDIINKLTPRQEGMNRH